MNGRLLFQFNTGILLVFLPLWSIAQEGDHEVRAREKNEIILSFGYTHIPKGAAHREENTSGFFVPSIGLDYMRKVGDKWGFGIMFDYELDHYLIIKKDLERKNVFIAVGGIAYRLIPHLLLFTGAGVELEENKNLFVYRLGAEYAIHINHRWLVAPAFFFDWKEGYDTYAISLGIGYNF